MRRHLGEQPAHIGPGYGPFGALAVAKAVGVPQWRGLVPGKGAGRPAPTLPGRCLREYLPHAHQAAVLEITNACALTENALALPIAAKTLGARGLKPRRTEIWEAEIT